MSERSLFLSTAGYAMKNLFQRSLDDYARYHRDPKNKLTHYLGIPIIVFAVVVFLRLIQGPQLAGINLDGALMAMIPIGIFYLALNLGTGLGMMLIFALMYALAPSVGTTLALILFIGGWVLQFIGHYFEGKKPAFFKNGVHLLIGPLWVLNDFYARLHLPAYTPEKA